MILITGGLGYLGGRIAEHLVMSGHKIRIATSRINPEVPSTLKSCELCFIDFFDESSLIKACNNVSHVIHLAAIGDKQARLNPEAALSINGLGTLKILDAAKKIGVSRFLYFSTIHIYGKFLCGEINESSLPFPQSYYSITHRLGEDLVIATSENKDYPTGTIFRLSNSFGYPIGEIDSCWQLAVNDFCYQAVQFKQIILESHGQDRRNFIPITDVCNVVEFWADDIDGKLDSYIYNLGGRTFTIYNIARKVGERCKVIFGWDIKISIKKRPDESFKSKLFSYNSQKLTNAGCNLKLDFNNEIDMLLKLLVSK